MFFQKLFRGEHFFFGGEARYILGSKFQVFKLSFYMKEQALLTNIWSKFYIYDIHIKATTLVF